MVKIKNKIVILGKNGFIASNLRKYFIKKKLKSIFLSSKYINLTKKNSIKKLKRSVKENDIIVFISAKAPVKNLWMLIDNIKILENVSKAIEKIKFKQLIYLSSDAVYSDSKRRITENFAKEPQNLHGIMHNLREIYLRNLYLKKLCILRPTLIYGSGDTHDGYGPNKYIRLAKKNFNIELFGKGEELRDHIHINDVVKIIYLSIKKNLVGEYNLCSGKLISFKRIALIVKRKLKSKSIIIFKKRNKIVPHNGYRCLDNSMIKKKLMIKKFIYLNNIKKSLLNV